MKSVRDTKRPIWQVNALLTGGVMATVLLALVLAQLDILQARAALISPGLPIVNIQATAIAVGRVIPWDLNPAGPLPVERLAEPAPDDLNPRPEFITGVGEDGAIFTVCGEVPEGWLLYTVQPGETLASLAAGTQSTAADLVAANCLGEAPLAAGMQILVPRAPAPSLCGPPAWWVRYQIRPGDTLGALAVNRGTTIDEILRANCRESLDLLAGQFIFLPPGGVSSSTSPIAQPSLTPLPPPTDIPTLAPLPTATDQPQQPPPLPTDPVVNTPIPPTATPPQLPTEPPPTDTPPPPPTEPPPTVTPLPPTDTPPPPPTDVPPTLTPEPPPTELPGEGGGP